MLGAGEFRWQSGRLGRLTTMVMVLLSFVVVVVVCIVMHTYHSLAVCFVWPFVSVHMAFFSRARQLFEVV